MRPWIGALLFLAACAGDDISDRDAEPDGSSDPLACDDRPISCDFDGPDCPSLDEICEGVSEGSAECCTCDLESGTWQVIVYDCALAPPA